MRRPIAAVAIVAVVAAAAAVAWTTVRREREYARLIAMGEAALAADQTLVAIESFSGAIALKGDSMLAYLKRGETYRRHGDLRAALRDLRLAADLDPTATRPLEQLGDVLYAQQRYDRAAERYAAYVALDDRSPRLLYKLGLARFQAGVSAAAVNPLRLAVRLNDRFAEAYYLLGLCLRSEGQLNDAAWALQRAVATGPTLVQPREALADLYAALGRHRERVEQLEAIAVLEPDRVGRHIAVGLAEAEAGHTELAVLAISRAAERHPDDMAVYSAVATVWLGVAESRHDHAALGKALQALRTLTARGTASASDQALLGRALLASGENEAALRALRDATARAPAPSGAWERLAVAAARVGRTSEARDALVRYSALVTTDRERSAVASRISDLSLRLRQPADAVHWLQRAVRLAPADAALLRKLADAQAAAGDDAGASASRAAAQGLGTSETDQKPAVRAHSGPL